MKCARLNSTFIIFWVVKMEFKNSHYSMAKRRQTKKRSTTEVGLSDRSILTKEIRIGKEALFWSHF